MPLEYHPINWSIQWHQLENKGEYPNATRAKFEQQHGLASPGPVPVDDAAHFSLGVRRD
jgi:hypothetical protein